MFRSASARRAPVRKTRRISIGAHILLVALLAALALVLSAKPATAQSSCGYQFQYCPLCGDPGVPGASCIEEGPYLSVCTVNRCAAAAASETGCGSCSRHRTPVTAGQPINLANGNTYIIQDDLRVPGLGGGLALSRTWNSRWPQTQTGSASGMFGQNWRSTYEERVFIGSDGTIKYSRSDGAFWSFGYNGSNWDAVAPANIGATLSRGDSYWTVKFKDGEQRLFGNSSGSLTAIVDRNGNAVTLSYDTANRLTTVTDAASRHLTFSYTNSSYPYQVTGVTYDVGVSLSYNYDTQGRLLAVTKPDTTTLTFEYNASSLITAVKDAEGKLLESHTYDSIGRGLTSSRAGGVDAITIAYPQ
jgi:YD repeat-containing protein